MREYNASTAKGQQLIKTGSKCCWSSLYNLYDKWSQAKEVAFNNCYNLYIASENHSDFGIGNATSYSFTASWLASKDGEDIMRIETGKNSYLIWLNR